MTDDAIAARELHLALNGRSRRGCLKERDDAAVARELHLALNGRPLDVEPHPPRPKDCGGVKLCPHGRRPRQCKECGGAAYCQHGKYRSQCRGCGGSAIC